MESLIATDWLKDYDPLFDLFDQEMRAANHESASATTNFYNSGQYNNECDLAGQYYNPLFNKQADELSLMLGLEWMPHLELASPSTTNSSSSPSAASSTTTNSSSSTSSSLAPTASNSPASTPVADSPATPCKKQQNHEAALIRTNNNANQPTTYLSQQLNISAAPTTTSHIISTPPTTTVSATNQSKLTGAAATTTTATAITNMQTPTKTANHTCPRPKLDSATENSGGVSSSIKKRKKALRPKGTSLLAQPAAKLLATTTASPVASPVAAAAAATVAAAPLSTLLTINLNNNRSPASLSNSQPLLNKPVTATLITSSSHQHLSGSCISKLQTITTTCNANAASLAVASASATLQQPSTCDNTMRHCIKIEHAYALTSIP